MLACVVYRIINSKRQSIKFKIRLFESQDYREFNNYKFISIQALVGKKMKFKVLLHNYTQNLILMLNLLINIFQ